MNFSDNDRLTKANRKRSKRFDVYLLDEEWELLNIKAQEAEMSKAEYIRNMILFGYAKERTVFSKEQERNIRNELNRIGTNINQIAIQANVSKNVDDENFKNLYNQYLELLDLFQEGFKGVENGNN